MNTEELARLRLEINALDDELLTILQKRAFLSTQVAKAKQGGTIFYPAREKEIISRLQNKNKEKIEKDMVQLPQESIAHIWTEIFSCSRMLQKKTSLAFLGPLGTFSHYAGEELFGKSLSYVPCSDFNSIFAKVFSGEANFGLIPLENSLQGTVGQCLDLFEKYSVSIIAEHYSSIHHCLLAQQNDFSKIKTIYSHPQALMQCHDWLQKNCPQAQIVELSSTAKGALRAMEEKDSAAIGNEKLVQLSQERKILQVIAKDIANCKDNTTRFAIIAKEKNSCSFVFPKSSFTFALADKTGALSKVLQIIQQENINLTKLESRPLYNKVQGTAWQYRFFADALANLWEKPMLMQALKEHCYDIRILGVYENLL